MASLTYGGVVLSAIIVCTLFGNFFAIFKLMKPNRHLLKRPLYIFICNICVADIAVVVFSMTFKTADEIAGDWLFGKVMCRIIEYIQRALFRVNVLTHLFIAYDRYYSVVFPLKPQMTRGRAIHTIVVAWIFSFAMSVPFLFSFDVREKDHTRLCMIVHLPWLWTEKLHNAIDLSLFFLLPFGILLWLYANIIRTLSRRKRQAVDVGSMHATLTTIRIAIRGVRVSVIVVITFTICWIPVIAKGFNRLFHNDVNTNRTDPLYATAMYFAFVNDALVPLLYCGLDSNLNPAASKWWSDHEGTRNEQDCKHPQM